MTYALIAALGASIMGFALDRTDDRWGFFWLVVLIGIGTPITAWLGV